MSSVDRHNDQSRPGWAGKTGWLRRGPPIRL